MPRGNALPTSNVTLKVLLGGQPKAGKTDWILRALEAGYNILYLDGDVASATIKSCVPPLSQAALSRLYYLDIRDRKVGTYESTMVDFMLEFVKESKVRWNDTKCEPFVAKNFAEGDEVWEIRPGQLDHTVILAVDSWSTLSHSAMGKKAIAESVDLMDVGNEKVDRKLYAGAGNALTQIALCLKDARCHVVVTFHPDEFQKYKATPGKTQREDKEDQKVLEWSMMIPKSSSRPHGYTLGQHFTDILWIDIMSAGRRQISGSVSKDRVSGGHFDKGDPRDGYRFVDLVQKVGGFIPGGDSPTDHWLTIYGPGEYQLPVRKPAPVLGQKPAASSATPAETPVKKITSMSGLTGLSALAAKKA